MSDELPASWTSAPLRDLVKVVGGGTPSKANPSYWMDGTVPWVSPKDFRTDVILDAQDHITQEAVASSTTNIVPKGAVLVVTRSGILSSSLPIAVTGKPVAINQDVKALVPYEGVSADYIAAALRRFAQSILVQCSKPGTTVPSILTPRLEAFHLPVAPSAEQVRVVAQINASLSRATSARQAVKTIPVLLARFQAAVMKVAMCGDATRAFRPRDAQNGPQSIIKAIASQRAEGGKAIVAALPELADAYALGTDVDWPFVTLDSVCDPARSITYGVIQTGEDTEGGVPTVRAGDIKNFGVNVGALKRVRREVSSRYPRTVLRGGEVLISIRGTTGTVAVAGEEMVGMNVSREVAVIPLLQSVEPKYVAYALASPAGQSLILRHVKGVAQSGINLVDLRSFPLPLPSHAEQLEIVRFIEDALARMNALRLLAEQIDRSLDALAAAVLRKAFRGQLTFQDPEDEPASALVDRSRATFAAAKSKPRPRARDKTQGDLFRRQNVPQGRKDVKVDHLRAIVAQASAKSMSVKELYLRADMEVDEFYKQLAIEVAPGGLRQTPDKARLELCDAA